MLATLPLLFLLFQNLNQNADLKHQILAYEELEDSYHTASVWVLNTTLSAGDTVSAEDFSKVILRTQDQTELSLLNEPADLEGFSAKTALTKGCIVTNEMFYQADDLLDDVRLVETTDLTLPESLAKQDYVDIRLRFPNGEDYIVISHKKVLQLLSDDNGVYGVELELNENELLRLSSARVDRDFYEGCSLYLIPYRMDFQESATKDYPVNPDVFTLMQWDPNILSQFTVSEEAEKREVLESHLRDYLQEESTDADVDSNIADSAGTSDGLEDSDSDSSNSVTIYHP